MTNMVFRDIGTDRSSIKNMGSNVLGAAVFVITAGFAWIPVIGYFAWIIPLVVLFAEKRSLILRFYCAEAFIIGLIRMLFDVVFNSVADIAKQTVALYGQDPGFLAFYGGEVTNAGSGALIIGGILAGILTLISLALAFMALMRIPIRIPGISQLCRIIADYRFTGKK